MPWATTAFSRPCRSAASTAARAAALGEVGLHLRAPAMSAHDGVAGFPEGRGRAAPIAPADPVTSATGVMRQSCATVEGSDKAH